MKRTEEIFRIKSRLESMKIRELTLICKPLKRKGDGKIPNKKESLILKYKERSGRPASSFNVSYFVSESECDDQYVNHDDTEFTCNNGHC